MDESGVAERWTKDFKKAMGMMTIDKKLCSHCLSNTAASFCKTTGFLFCSNQCRNESWARKNSVYQYVYTELIGAGKKREREPEEEEDEEARQRRKVLAEKEAAKGRSKSAKEAAEWIQEHKTTGAGKERVHQLLSVLKINRSFLKTLLKNTDKRTIASWILISPEFLQFIWNNGYFWYLYLARYDRETLNLAFEYAGYDKRNDKKYVNIGKRNLHALNNSLGIVAAKSMLRNEEAMKSFISNMTIADLRNYFLTSYGFKTLLWNSPYFWYYVAKQNGLVNMPMNTGDLDNYRQLSLARIYPRCKYYLNMHYSGVDNGDESFEIIANDGDNIVNILENNFISCLETCTVTKTVPFTQELPALDYMFTSECIFRYDEKTYDYQNGSFDGTNIRDMLQLLPAPEEVEDREIHISCYCNYLPVRFEVNIQIPEELTVLGGMEEGNMFELPFETLCTEEMSKIFAEKWWPAVWSVKGESNIEKEQQELNEYAIVVSFDHDTGGVIEEENEVMVIPSIFEQPFKRIMDFLGDYNWAGDGDSTVSIRIEILKGEK
jgi:hypothetical protein